MNTLDLIIYCIGPAILAVILSMTVSAQLTFCIMSAVIITILLVKRRRETLQQKIGNHIGEMVGASVRDFTSGVMGERVGSMAGFAASQYVSSYTTEGVTKIAEYIPENASTYIAVATVVWGKWNKK
jgi:ABC-type transport system involved in cytochrome bd biosynthesis fused ATPase/permease subunit